MHQCFSRCVLFRYGVYFTKGSLSCMYVYRYLSSIVLPYCEGAVAGGDEGCGGGEAFGLVFDSRNCKSGSQAYIPDIDRMASPSPKSWARCIMSSS